MWRILVPILQCKHVPVSGWSCLAVHNYLMRVTQIMARVSRFMIKEKHTRRNILSMVGFPIMLLPSFRLHDQRSKSYGSDLRRVFKAKLGNDGFESRNSFGLEGEL